MYKLSKSIPRERDNSRILYDGDLIRGRPSLKIENQRALVTCHKDSIFSHFCKNFLADEISSEKFGYFSTCKPPTRFWFHRIRHRGSRYVDRVVFMPFVKGIRTPAKIGSS